MVEDKPIAVKKKRNLWLWYIGVIVVIVLGIVWLSRGEFKLSSEIIYVAVFCFVAFLIYKFYTGRKVKVDYHKVLLDAVNRHYEETGQVIDYTTAVIDEVPPLSNRYIIDFGNGTVLRYDANTQSFFAKRYSTLVRLAKRDAENRFLEDGLRKSKREQQMEEKLEEAGYNVLD